jgi:hypothetical protein
MLRSRPATGRPTAAAGADRLLEIHARRRERRRGAEREHHHHRDAGGEKEDAHVQRRRRGVGKTRWRQAREIPQEGHGERHAEPGTERREHGVLGEQLSRDAGIGGPERLPHGHFPDADGASREQQIREVGARNQQHHSHRHHQQRHRRPYVAREVLLQGGHGYPGSPIGPRKLTPQLARQIGHVGLSLQHGDARLQPRHRVHEVAGAQLELDRRELRRNPERGVLVGKAEIGRHDPHHGVRQAIQPDRPAHHGRVRGKTGPPGALVDHHDRGRIGPVVGLHQRAAEKRLRPEHGEQVSRRPDARELARFSGARQVVVVDGVSGHAGERPVARPPRRVIARGHFDARRAAHRGQVLPQQDKAVGLRKRQRPEEHGTDGAEDRRIGADAERQHRDGHGGEAGRRTQRAQRVTDVLCGRRERGPDLHGHLDGAADRSVGVRFRTAARATSWVWPDAGRRDVAPRAAEGAACTRPSRC